MGKYQIKSKAHKENGLMKKETKYQEKLIKYQLMGMDDMRLGRMLCHTMPNHGVNYMATR